MALRVRERPPLRLSVGIETPDGVFARWGSDDPNPANGPQELTFSTVMPGGFDQMSCTLERKLNQQYGDLQEIANVTVYGPGNQTAWQGRLEQLPDTGGTQAQINPQCMGWQSHLDDDDSASMVYVDGSMSSWQGPSVQRQINILQVSGFFLNSLSFQSTADPANGNPALVFSGTYPWSGTNEADAFYDAGPNNGVGEIFVLSSRQLATTGIIDTNSAPSTLNYGMSSTDTLTATDLVTGQVLGGSFNHTSTAGYRYGVIVWVNNTSGGVVGTTPPSGATLGFALENVVVLGDHGLPTQGSPPGLLASDVIAHAVGTWCPKLAFSTGVNGTIPPSTFIIPQLVFNTPTTSSTIIKQAAQYEILDWAVWEGPTFYANQRGARGNQWQTRIGPSQLQETGPTISRIWNGVIVTYTDVSGVQQTVGPILDPDPTNPATEAGLNRYALVTMGTSTSVAATQVGNLFLQEQKLIDTSGQATLTGHVQDGSGIWWPAWAVRAGDYISVIDSSDPSPRRIVSTSYDDTQKANSLQLDQPPDGMTALLERLSIVLTPAGLS